LETGSTSDFVVPLFSQFACELRDNGSYQPAKA
jgi:hypothetical protein